MAAVHLFILALLTLRCLSAMSGLPQAAHPLQDGAVQGTRRLSPSELQPLPPPVRCKTCLELVEFHYCESDKNGNQDRPVAICRKVNQATGEKCNFIRMGGTRSPSSSPQPNTVGPSTTNTTPPAPPNNSSQVCSTAGCQRRNISKYCEVDKCLQCCHKEGGCLGLKSHTIKGVTVPRQPVPSPATPAIANPISPALKDAIVPNPITQPEPVIAPIVPHTKTTTVKGKRSNSVPTPAPKARHSSHMLPSFTAQLDLQRDLAEQKRKRDEERIQSEKRLQHTVVVYSWLASNTPAKSRAYQAGGNGAYFVVGKDVFAHVGLLEALEEEKVEVYFEALGSWTHTGPDYTIALKHKHHHIYLRHESAVVTLGLDDHLHAAIAANSHIRTNLAPERSYSRQVYKQASPTPAPPRPSTSHSGPSKLQVPVAITPLRVPKRRHESPPLSPQPAPMKQEPPRVPPSSSSHPSLPSNIKTKPAPRPVSKKIKSELKPDTKPKLEIRSFSPIDLTVGSLSPSPSPSRPSTPRPSSHVGGGNSKNDAIEVDSDYEYTTWPADYPVYQVAAFLHEIKTLPRSTKQKPQPSHASIFKCHFPDADYHKSTVNDQARKFRKAPQELKQEALDAKDQHLGKWSTFASNLRLYQKAKRPATPPSPVFSDNGNFIDLT